MNKQAPEHRVTLIGGPLDGWPIVVRGTLPEELRLPYSREMLDLAARAPSADAREQWGEIRFPSEADADGLALYRPDRQTAARDPAYRYVGTDAT